MPTSIVVGMRKAAELALQEGLEERYQRHKDMAAFARKGLKDIQLELFPDAEAASNTVSAVKAEPKWEAKLRSELVSRFDIMIAGGLGHLEGKILRIGHMGTSAKKTAISTTLAAMGTVLEDIRA
jgi:alanine-glyoxylate transaminase/serine-glyoxylate transaminase/serine-pyruvate transaminase